MGPSPGKLLLPYAVLNAILYSALLPLWEGFDEPFHFAHVQDVARGGLVPDANASVLSREVVATFPLTPASPTVKVNLRTSPTYDEFFRAPTGRRAAMRRALFDIPWEWRQMDSCSPNYEAHQPPLAYWALAVPEFAFRRMPLPYRVLLLRILASLAGALLLYSGAQALCRELAVSEPFASIAVFCVLSSQMTWATLAHVANDWLAVPLAVWTLVWTIRCAAAPTVRNVMTASLLASAGLLAKAYFLAIEPLVFGVCVLYGGRKRVALHASIVAVFAAPWYAHNMLAYRVLTGMQEARAGFGGSAVARSAMEMNWPKTMLDTARFSLWTGNNTFRPFCTTTIDAVILLCAAALLMWAVKRKEPAERIAAVYCCLFGLAFVYAAALAQAATYGRSSTPSPWYQQVIVTPLLALGLLGASRWGRRGRALAAAIALLFGYVLAVSYVFRLIPVYAGFDGRGSAGAVLALYWNRFGEVLDKLGAAALGPPWLVLGLAGVVVMLAAAQAAAFIRQMLRANP